MESTIGLIELKARTVAKVDIITCWTLALVDGFAIEEVEFLRAGCRAGGSE
jgi:hypothetical protein